MIAAHSSIPPAEDGALSAARRWTDADGTHIDVRGLAPPAPFLAILTLVRSMPPGSTVLVHHEREPMLLYPELAEMGWTAERIDAPAGEVRLRLVPVA